MSREALFQKRPRKLESGACYARSFTVAEVKHVETLHKDGKDDEAMAFTVRQCAVDEKGNRILGDDDSLDDLPIDTVREICDLVSKLTSGAKVERLAKNSDGTDSSGS